MKFGYLLDLELERKGWKCVDSGSCYSGVNIFRCENCKLIGPSWYLSVDENKNPSGWLIDISKLSREKKEFSIERHGRCPRCLGKVRQTD